MTPEILQSKRRRRYLERVWRKPYSSLDRSLYSKQCHYCNRQMAKAKSDYYTNMVLNKSTSAMERHKSNLTRFNKICHPSQRPRWQVDKEAIGLSIVQQCSTQALCQKQSKFYTGGLLHLYLIIFQSSLYVTRSLVILRTK